MPQKIPAGADLNDYIIPGDYYCPDDATAASIINSKQPNAFSLHVDPLVDGRFVFQTIQYWSAPTVQKSIEYKRCSYPVWEEWIATVTATPPQKIGAAIESGLMGTLSFRKNQFSEVRLTGDVASSVGMPVGDIILATIPPGYQPDECTILNAKIKAVGGGYVDEANVYIDTDGKIHFDSPGVNIVTINDSYYAAQ